MKPKKRKKAAKKKKKPAKKAAPKKDLFSQVVKLSGIPAASIQKELKDILDKKNIDLNHLTLDQLRQVAASYLREIMCSVLDRRPRQPES